MDLVLVLVDQKHIYFMLKCCLIIGMPAASFLRFLLFYDYSYINDVKMR